MAEADTLLPESYYKYIQNAGAVIPLARARHKLKCHIEPKVVRRAGGREEGRNKQAVKPIRRHFNAARRNNRSFKISLESEFHNSGFSGVVLGTIAGSKTINAIGLLAKPLAAMTIDRLISDVILS